MHEISRAVGLLAGRLARFLQPDESGQHKHAHEFLTSCYQEATSRPHLVATTVQPLDRLASAYQLTQDDIDALLLAGMPEEHEGYAAVMRLLHPRNEPRLSVGLLAHLQQTEGRSRSSFRARLETGILLRSGLIRLRGDVPFYEMTVEPGECVWSALHGSDIWPPQIATYSGEIVSCGLEDWLADPPATKAIQVLILGRECTVLVTAETEEIAFHRGLALVAASSGRPVGVMMPAAASLADLERSLQIHALARDVVPVVQIAYAEGPVTPPVPAFHSYPRPAVVCGKRGAVALRAQRPIVVVPVERPTPEATRRMWSILAPELKDEVAALAARYPIEPVYAAEAVRDARYIESEPLSVNHVAAAIQARSSLLLSGGVQLVKPAARRDDLVLSPDRMRQIEEALDRLLHQQRVLDDWGFLRQRAGARGVRMLFAGPPGTGKTLTAEVMAHTLDMNLLIVDISRVVSKWIGETEKNLAAVFDTAERARAVLFFDEADALFGKRTEVSDAHDRYANLETAYLLSRLERFEGLAILGTNLRQNIDPAFVRRLEFSVNFDEPGREERVALWNVHLPKSAPVGADVNVKELAALFPVVGALIRNASVAGAFLAAADGGVIRRSHLIHGLRREYEKAGKAFPGLPTSIPGGPDTNERGRTKEAQWQ